MTSKVEMTKKFARPCVCVVVVYGAIFEMNLRARHLLTGWLEGRAGGLDGIGRRVTFKPLS